MVVCQRKRIFVYLSYSWVREFRLGMKVCAWYIDSNGNGNKHIVKYPYPIGIKTLEIPILDT